MYWTGNNVFVFIWTWRHHMHMTSQYFSHMYTNSYKDSVCRHYTHTYVTVGEHNHFLCISLSNSLFLPEYTFTVGLRLLWMQLLSVWTCAWSSSRQRLSGEKPNFNENECNMWNQVSHWSIRASEPIQHLNLPPSLLTRPRQCQPLLFSRVSSLLPSCCSLFGCSLTHPFVHQKQLCCQWVGELRTFHSGKNKRI